MRIDLHTTILSALLLVALHGGEAAVVPPGTLPQLEFVANLAAEVHQDAPISLASGGLLSLRLINTCGAPVGMSQIQAPAPTYPLVVHLLDPRPVAPQDERDPAWGPYVGEQLRCNLRMVLASPHWPAWAGASDAGQDPVVKQRRLLRQSRGRLALMPQEGYALMYRFAPGWMFEDDRPKTKGLKQLAIVAPGLRFTLCIPAKKNGIPIGKPIVWDEEHANSLISTKRKVEFREAAGEAPAELARPGESPLLLRLEIDAAASRDQDLPVTYLVGNVSKEPVWVWQNTLTPANLTWTLTGADGGILGSADGSASSPLQRLLPARAAFLLLPGEFLCWKHAVPGQLLGAVRKGRTYALTATLPGATAPREPEPGDAPAQSPTMTGSASFTVR